MKRLVSLCLLTLAFLTAHAEGCDSTPRPLTAQEKTFYSKFTVLRAALPKPPAGWQYKDETQEQLSPDYQYVPSEYCPNTGYYVGIDAGYTRPMTQADSDQEMAAMQAKPDPAMQKKLDALMARQQALIEKIGAAAQKQDFKAMDALGKQNDALSKEIQAAQANANGGGRATIGAIQADREATVQLSINSAVGVDCYGSPKALQVPGATAFECEHPATYRSPGDQLDPPLGRIVVVFGPVKLRSDDHWNRKDAQGKDTADKGIILDTPGEVHGSTKVGLVIVDIHGDNLARAESLYKQMNLKPLATLIGH